MCKLILFFLGILCSCLIGDSTAPSKEALRRFNMTMSYRAQNANDTEIFIGEKGIILLNVTLPNTTLQNISMILERSISNVDFGEYHMTGGKGKAQYGTPDSKVAFWRFTNLKLKFTDISSTFINCTVDIYLHNGWGLKDNEYFSISSSLLLNGQPMVNDKVFIAARTSMKREMHKTFRAEVSQPLRFATQEGTALQISFKAWIPIYNPSISVTVTKTMSKSYENKLNIMDNLFKISYLKTTHVGENFKPGANIGLLSSYDCLGMDLIELKFPTYWVNRGFYQSENTTDDDVIQFETLVWFTNFPEAENTSLVKIDIWLNESMVWKTFDINLIHVERGDIPDVHFQEAPDSLINSTKLLISSTENPSNETRSPFNTKRLLLYLDVRNQKSSKEETIVLIDAAITNVTEQKELLVSIGSINISFIESTANIHCINLNVSYSKTDYVLSQNDAEIKINYLKNVFENSDPAWISFEIIIEFICKNRGIGVTEFKLLAWISNQNDTVMYAKSIQQPEIFHDLNNRLLSQLHTVLDDNKTTCISLPRNGETPPVFWIRMQTYWFDIHLNRFNLTLIGENLSCSGHGGRTIQVSYPTPSSKGRFYGDLLQCRLHENKYTNQEGLKLNSLCSFDCQCTNPVECSEVYVFMSAKEDLEWKLCEMTATQT